jgi:hypothetical protein
MSLIITCGTRGCFVVLVFPDPVLLLLLLLWFLFLLFVSLLLL